jgi:hypothetical protein
MKITVTHDDGSQQDITELVQVSYDVATHSMDWGSGFLDQEETDGLIALAVACRFPSLSEIAEEEWRRRGAEGKSHSELEQIAISRGKRWWHEVKPTELEIQQMLEDSKAGRVRDTP